MKLYRGSRCKTNRIHAEEVHPNDFSKFPDLRPEKVIWATDSRLKAEIFAVFANRMAFEIDYKIRSSTNSPPPIDFITTDDMTWTLRTERELQPEELLEPAYIHEIPAEGFSRIGGSNEFYSTQDTVTPTRLVETTVGELLAKWKQEGNIELRFGELDRLDLPRLRG